MSGSETGVMASREAFSVGLQQKTQPLVQNMRLAFGVDSGSVYKPVGAATAASTSTSTSPTFQPSGDGGSTTAIAGGGAMVNVNVSSMGGSGGETVKRKRGRPRKYGPDGAVALGLTPAPQSVTVNQSGGVFSSPPPLPSVPTPPSGGSASPTSFKKARGRPPGSSKKQQLEALGNRYFP
jgi:hypothetical protein